MTDEEGLYFSKPQQIALAVTPIITGALSSIGSGCIIFIISKDWRRKIQKPYHRILFGLSVSDFVNSVRASTSSILMPSDTPGVWLARGNQRTCSAQGFFSQLGLTTTLYSASLALYFVMKIQPRQKSDQLIRRAEPFLHGIPIIYGLATATSGLVMDLYNPVKLGIGCWVAAYPIGCLDDETTECTRGENADVLIWIFAGFVVAVSLVLVTVCMIVIYYRVKQQVKRIELRYGVVREQNTNSTLSQKLRSTFEQATMYILAFILTYLCVCILRVTENDGRSETFFVLSLGSQIFYPLQGCFNFFIYARPRYLELKQSHPGESSLSLGRRLFEMPVPECRSQPDLSYISNRHEKTNTDMRRTSDDQPGLFVDKMNNSRAEDLATGDRIRITARNDEATSCGQLLA